MDWRLVQGEVIVVMCCMSSCPTQAFDSQASTSLTVCLWDVFAVEIFCAIFNKVSRDDPYLAFSFLSEFDKTNPHLNHNLTWPAVAWDYTEKTWPEAPDLCDRTAQMPPNEHNRAQRLQLAPLLRFSGPWLTLDWALDLSRERLQLVVVQCCFGQIHSCWGEPEIKVARIVCYGILLFSPSSQNQTSPLLLHKAETVPGTGWHSATSSSASRPSTLPTFHSVRTNGCHVSRMDQAAGLHT